MKIKWILPVLVACSTSHVQADVSILVPFASKHYGCDHKKHTCDFHQFNPGLGLEWSPQEYGWGRPIVRAAGYSDSGAKFAYFVAGGWRKDFNIVDSVKLGLGIYAGYLNGSDQNGFAALPFVSVGYKKLSFEVGYGDSKAGHHKHKEDVNHILTFSARYDL
ncbi:hypothetical protein [Chromobacterium violaceum]|uniref:Uncharacterized protein n=1 Tax=Chromobacterium violaceum TaxID=536 RepID=A0AAX2MEG5_CHRVL|nr:hypothetical protein [Chromobacterium violaceum]STB69588.1 Uncharacterised protein [Chromobacterium violaceum]SUY93146.1 Uncharacterised protein [Chromobacterium violaceum]